MQITFLESKEGSKTFSADGMFYHSSYSPSKEAQRFAQSAQFPYNPKLIFLLEPGLNYGLDFFKQRFAQCKIVCVRFFDYTFEDQASWDYLLKYHKNIISPQSLINNFGEETLLSSSLLIWKPAESLFAKEIEEFICIYKTCLENCKTLLVTRQFFEKKWLINSCNFVLNAQNLLMLKGSLSLPLVITASGPSLEGAIKTIKENRKNIFLLCLSSALSVLIKNDIKPDLILTTDGGYWAGEHLKYLKKNKDIPLALPAESFVPKDILKKNKLLLLSYKDSSSFISNEILDQADLTSFQAQRNPTVSGTAFYFAKSLTENKIFFCGLDLAAKQGFQHSQPNELERNNSLLDTRIKTKEARQSSSRFNSSSLQIYRDWFISLDKNETSGVFRVIEKNSQDSLGNIKNIDYKDFEEEITKFQKDNIAAPKIEFSESSINAQKRQQAINHVIRMLDSPKWSRQIFPADYISMENAADENDRKVTQQRLNEKIQKLVGKIGKLIND